MKIHTALPSPSARKMMALEEAQRKKRELKEKKAEIPACTLRQMMGDADIVATWNVPMSNNIYKIEFCHGTTTGKRIIRVNGKEILRREWMFKLVGREFFELNEVRCVISIEAIGIFAYEYSLKVGGKSFEKFREQQNKALQVWHVSLVQATPSASAAAAAASNDDDNDGGGGTGEGGSGADYGGGGSSGHDVRVCLEKDTMEIWVNGAKVNTTGEFMENGGTRTHFAVTPVAAAPSAAIGCFIESESSGKRSVGILHKLYVNGNFIAHTTDDAFVDAK